MMNKHSQDLLWRVEWNHRSGYQAPTYYVEAKKRKDAIKEAKRKSRLSDFPKVWSFRLTKLFHGDGD